MSTAVETKTQYTPEDLLAMPDGKSYELVDGQPIISGGFMHLPQGPGLGITLKPEVRRRPGVE